MAHMLAELVEKRPCEHPATQAMPEWQLKAAEAAQALDELYQAIGAEHLPPKRQGSVASR